MNILEIQNCTICYQNGRPAVSDASLSVSEGEIVSIVGESGSGKTTLIRAILGLLPAGEGLPVEVFCSTDVIW